MLAALYNQASAGPAGSLAGLAYTPVPMTLSQAQQLLAHSTDQYFDYVSERCLKVSLAGDTLDPWLYDRDHGAGAAQRIIQALREARPDATPDRQVTF